MVKRGIGAAIYKLIKDSDRPLSTLEISKQLNISWHTADRYCLKLQVDNSISNFTIGKATAWFIRGERK